MLFKYVATLQKCLAKMVNNLLLVACRCRDECVLFVCLFYTFRPTSLSAWDETKRLHIQHCYLFHGQHRASCVLCKEVPEVSLDTSSVFQGESLQEDMLFVCLLVAKGGQVVQSPLTSRTANRC